MTALTEFIDDMRTKYAPDTLFGQQAPGQALAPPGEIPPGPTSRFTGLGPDNQLQRGKVAGKVHEGEQVVEADAVEDAGGPGKIRDAVDGLIAEGNGKTNSRQRFGPQGGGDTFNPPQKGFKGGTGAKALPLTGYQEGTDDDVVPPRGDTFGPFGNIPPADDNVPNSVRDPKALTRFGTSSKIPGAGVPNIIPDIPTDIAGVTPPGDLKIPTDPLLKFPGDEVDPTDVDKDKVETPEGGRFGIDALKRIARGTSKAADLAERQARQRLEGSQAARAGAQAQALAQGEFEGGEAAIEKARLSRQAGIETVGLESELAISRAERAEKAAGTVAGIELTKEQLQIEREGLAEIIRKNKAGEKLTETDLELQRRSIDEIIRKNKAGEGLTKEEIEIQRTNVNEIIRKNKAGETLTVGQQKLRRSELDEVIRKNKAGETLTGTQIELQKSELNEIIRKNKAGEGLTKRQLDIQQQGQDTIDKKIASDIALTEQEIAIRRDKFIMEKNQAIAETLIKNGQFGLAEKVMNDMGMKVIGEIKDKDGNVVPVRFNFADAAKDFYDTKMYTALGNAANVINTTEQAKNIIGSTSTADAWTDLNKASNSQLKNELERAWNAMVVDKDGKVPEGQGWGSEESKQWAKDNIVSTKLQNDAFYQASDNLSTGTMNAILATTDTKLADFEFAGRKGEEAFKLAWTNVMATGGIQIGEDGQITVDPDNPALKALGIKTVEAAVGAAKLSKAETPEERVDILVSGLEGKEGKPAEFQFSDFTSKDLQSLHDNPAGIAKLQTLGVFDFNLKSTNNLEFDVTRTGEFDKFFSDLGATKHAGGFSDPGSRRYDSSFVANKEDDGPKILIGGTLYELRGFETHKFGKGVSGIDEFRRGTLYAYKLDKDGKRIGNEVVKLKTGERDI